MADADLERTLAPALPLTIAAEGTLIWLVGGEDLRWTIEAPGAARWLRDALDRMDGKRTLGEVLESLAPEFRTDAKATLEALASERVLIGEEEPRSWRAFAPSVVGEGVLADALRGSLASANDGAPLVVHAQQTLDYAGARAVARQAAERGQHYLWCTVGARSRAFVSPVFAPSAGPCVGCLHSAFRRLSPTPELYDVLDVHAESGRPFASATVPEAFLRAVIAHVGWKLALLAQPLVPAAPYRLHVLEWLDGAVTSHPVRVDPDCPEGHR